MQDKITNFLFFLKYISLSSYGAISQDGPKSSESALSPRCAQLPKAVWQHSRTRSRCTSRSGLLLAESSLCLPSPARSAPGYTSDVKGTTGLKAPSMPGDDWSHNFTFSGANGLRVIVLISIRNVSLALTTHEINASVCRH